MAAALTHPETGSAHSETGQREEGGRSGLFRRFLSALIAARQRQADRELAQILGRRGGVMSDAHASRPVARRRYPYPDVPAEGRGR